jgi:alginate O-acetyltransferase complex protein AlgI
MLSTDFLFYICTAAILLLFYSVRTPVLQTLVLSAGSFAMYATEGLPFLLLLIANTAFTAVCSFMIAYYEPRRAKLAMIAGVAANVGVLAVFKYKQLLLPIHPEPSVPWLREFLAFGLPIGISFYTFHGVSLLVDVWRNPEVLRHRQNFALHGLDTALYLAFFPQLVAGPITRGKMFFPQIDVKRLRDVAWADALTNIIVGLFLKRVIADNLNPLTLPLTDSRTYAGTPHGELIAMVIGYSAQIFADFAGYSLIAIGIAQLFGYRLPDNFNQPYRAQSITEFWRRWHMSLSAWLKEYLYIPLGGNRRGPVRTYANLLIVMGLGGLWHGADWKFALWGLWHGAWLCVERLFGIEERSRGAFGFFRMVLTFSIVTLGWLFFRLSSLSDIGLLLHQFAEPWRQLNTSLTGWVNVVMIYTLCGIALLFHLPPRYEGRVDRWDALRRASAPYLCGFLLGLVLTATTHPATAVFMLVMLLVLLVVPIRYFSSPHGWDAQLNSLRPYGLGFLAAAVVMSSGSRQAFIYFQF